jgi:prepilin-type N-terminal cleavage/methylation domain-containing protein
MKLASMKLRFPNLGRARLLTSRVFSVDHGSASPYHKSPGRATLRRSPNFSASYAATVDHGSAGASPYRAQGERGFTMIEIAIALAVIAFALVAIIGVLPIGLNVQRDNRAETIINQDATYWLEAIRSGAQGLDDLTNYIESITISWTTPQPGSTMFKNAFLQGAQPPTFASGAEIIGLLSTPALNGTNVEAIVRTISGPATEKVTKANAPGAELAFRYRLTSAVAVVDPTVTRDFNSAVAGGTPEPMSTLFDIQLRFNWPVFGNNTRGTRQKTYRSLASRYLVATNAANGVSYYFLTP